MTLWLSTEATPWLFAREGGDRRGETGVQVGIRWADNDIRPAGDLGLAVAYGIGAARVFNRKWSLFIDFNLSEHDSREFCLDNPNCSALTPVAHHKVETFGMERRLRPGPKGRQLVFGLGTGMMDVEWNGARIHQGLHSFNVDRRRPLGPGVLRWTGLVETAFGGRTEAQFFGALDWARLTNVVALGGWGSDFGKRISAPAPVFGGTEPMSIVPAGNPGR